MTITAQITTNSCQTAGERGRGGRDNVPGCPADLAPFSRYFSLLPRPLWSVNVKSQISSTAAATAADDDDDDDDLLLLSFSFFLSRVLAAVH